jgi:hypothetical protein
MSRVPLASFLILALGGLSQALAETPSPPAGRWTVDLEHCSASRDPDAACDGIVNSEVCAKQVELCSLARRPQFVTRSDKGLMLTLRSGRTITLVDGVALPGAVELIRGTDGGPVDAWHFREFHPGLDAFVIHAQYYESVLYFIIRQRDGAAFEMPGAPVISDSGASVAEVGVKPIDVAGYVRIWVGLSSRPSSPTSWTLRPHHREGACFDRISDAHWSDDATLFARITSQCHGPDPGDGITGPVLFRNHRGAWTLEPAPPVADPQPGRP